ncbi:DUF488 family protein [Paenarthrobacter sp. YJN-5]|uniref:DUF488 domain-containing protein n=1 Tax=Paenarthrobacter sp. YJN-5 TaxID=2735316 RepID=UPI001877921E|nr:DUF488 domain-containing protein [Paenarthrobacter sp. YJN-5]QOT15403.1 DUF488 domain-containing protein [Paenarthrobacter sp. YJN-5]
MAGMQLFTVGHGTTPQADFVELLRWAEVESLVDVRIGPGSRKHPHFGKDSMEAWLPEAGIAYRWEKELGGFRKLLSDSPDTSLRNDSFRAYAGYMRTPEFEAALKQLLAEADRQRTAIMCSETVWWRCHRRLISDHCTLLDGVHVRHLMPGPKLVDHAVTSGSRVLDGQLRYDTPTG